MRRPTANPPVHQHPEGVPGTVPYGQNHHTGRKKFLLPGLLRHHPPDLPVFHCQIGYLAAEGYGASQADDFLADLFYNSPQHIGSDVGLILVKNGRVCPDFHQGI